MRIRVTRLRLYSGRYYFYYGRNLALIGIVNFKNINFSSLTKEINIFDKYGLPIKESEIEDNMYIFTMPCNRVDDDKELCSLGLNDFNKVDYFLFSKDSLRKVIKNSCFEISDCCRCDFLVDNFMQNTFIIKYQLAGISLFRRI